MKKLIKFTCYLCVLVVLTACEKQQPIRPSGKKVPVGVVIANEASIKNLGKQGLLGIRLVQKWYPYLNNGDTVELFVESDHSKPKLTEQVIEKLITQHNVVALLVFSNSDSVIAASHLADRHKVPLLALTATHPDVTKNRTFVNQFVFDDLFQGAVTALYVRDELLVDNVAVISDSAHISSQFLAEEFIKKFQSVTGTVTNYIALQDDMLDYRALVDEIRKKQPDLLYLPISAIKMIPILQEIKRQQWPVRLMSSDGLIAQFMVEHADKLVLAENMQSTDFFGNGLSLTPFGKKLEKVYEFKYNDLFNSYAPLGAEGYAYLLQALNACAPPRKGQCMNNRLRSIDDFIGLIGRVTILPNGKARRPLVVNAIRNSQPQFLVKVY